jgi:hypothetical protein
MAPTDAEFIKDYMRKILITALGAVALTKKDWNLSLKFWTGIDR